LDLETKEKLEIDFWRNSPTENPGLNSIETIVDKMSDAVILLECLSQYRDIFSRATTVLELGAGQGWASCIVKRLYPRTKVTTTDISEYALASIHKWEHIFQVKVDAVKACRSYQIPENDGSINCIFCFASAHHFAAHRRTFEEIYRVLAPDGNCIYFYEPSCPSYIHTLAKWRVNRKRPQVPEDVLIFRKIRALARSTGLSCTLDFYPSISKRGPIETVYYAVLRQFPVLQHLIPSTGQLDCYRFCVKDVLVAAIKSFDMRLHR